MFVCWTYLLNMKIFIWKLEAPKAPKFRVDASWKKWIIHCKNYFVILPKIADNKMRLLYQKYFFKLWKYICFWAFGRWRNAFCFRGQFGRCYICFSLTFFLDQESFLIHIKCISALVFISFVIFITSIANSKIIFNRPIDLLY